MVLVCSFKPNKSNTMQISMSQKIVEVDEDLCINIAFAVVKLLAEEAA